MAAEELLQAGLIDGLMMEADLREFVSKRLDTAGVKSRGKMRHVTVSQYLASDEPTIDDVAADKRIAIVYASGAIGMGKNTDPFDGEGIYPKNLIADLRRAANDDDINGIILRIDSPGGSVIGSDEIWREIRVLREKKPIYASMSDVAASGGYYIAMANGGRDDVIFAEPATLTGSIGVIIPHFDLSKLMKKLDIEDDSISSGPLKEMLSPTKERTPELAARERKILQSLVDDMFSRFKEIVKEGRPKLDDAKVAQVATGQIFTAKQAQEAGLVDRIGFLEDAVDRAVELAGLTKDTARVVKYTRQRGLIDEVLGGAGPGARLSVEAFAEWTTPRAWYLCSWWPAVIASQP
jgi:protease-4